MANGPYAVAPDQLHTVGGLYRFHFWRPAEAEYAWIAYRLREQRFETWRRDRLARAFWVGPLPPTAAASAVLERCFLAKT